MRFAQYHAALVVNAVIGLACSASEPRDIAPMIDAGSISSDDSRFVSQQISATTTISTRLPVRITMQNTGANAWTSDVHLDLTSGAWPEATLEIDRTTTVARGATYDFEALIEAPNEIGSHALSFRLARSAVPFGETTPALTIRALPADCADPASKAWLAEPAAGDIVRGIVDIALVDSACIAWMEVLIDGRRVHTTDAAPWTYRWDTALAHTNELPEPTHPIALGYYYADGRYGDHTAEVRSYTNLYVALPRGYDTSLDWRPLFLTSISNAAADGRRILLAMDDDSIWDEVLNLAAPHWNAVELLEVGHEPNWTRQETETKIASLEAALTAHGLGDRPIGVVYTAEQSLIVDFDAAGLDWAGIEGYVDPPGSADAEANAAVLDAQLAAAMARVPDDRSIVLVMMAYDRNGLWPDIETLSALQLPLYLRAYADARVVAIAMFSYARPGGSRDHPELKIPHMLIGERVLGVTVPALSNGEHTIETIVGHHNAHVTSERLRVIVSSP